MNAYNVDLFTISCFNWIHVLIELGGKLTERVNQAKAGRRYSDAQPIRDDLNAKIRLNLNDLLKRRQEEKKVDKKTNLLVFSGAAAVAVVVVAILSL